MRRGFRDLSELNSFSVNHFPYELDVSRFIRGSLSEFPPNSRLVHLLISFQIDTNLGVLTLLLIWYSFKSLTLVGLIHLSFQFSVVFLL